MTGPWIAAFAALCLVVLTLGLIVLGTLRRITVVLEQSESVLRGARNGLGGLEPGTEMPYFEAESWDGSVFASSRLVGEPSLVLFLSRTCRACRTLLDDLERVDVSALGRVVAVVNDARDATVIAQRTGLDVVIQSDRAIAEAFRSNATPHAFAVDEHGRIAATGIPNTLDALRRLMSQVEGGERLLAEADTPVHA